MSKKSRKSFWISSTGNAEAIRSGNGSAHTSHPTPDRPMPYEPLWVRVVEVTPRSLLALRLPDEERVLIPLDAVVPVIGPHATPMAPGQTTVILVKPWAKAGFTNW